MEVKRRMRLGEEGWRAALRRHGESGLSVREFCEREGLGSVSFYQWRARLSTPVRRRQAAKEPETVKVPQPTPVAGFLDLGSLSVPAPSGRMEVRLDLGGGLVLHVVRS